MKKNSIGTFFCLPLITLFFWQGSSCHSANTEMSKNSERIVNVNANERANANDKANDNSVVNKNDGAVSAPTPTPTRTDVSGVWGGQHIRIEVGESGAEVEFDCAHGTINERIAADSEGKFVAKGSFTREHGGPMRSGEDTKGEPATYSGSIEGRTMSLTVKLSKGDVIGTYTLTHGQMGKVVKCL